MIKLIAIGIIIIGLCNNIQIYGSESKLIFNVKTIHDLLSKNQNELNTDSFPKKISYGPCFPLDEPSCYEEKKWTGSTNMSGQLLINYSTTTLSASSPILLEISDVNGNKIDKVSVDLVVRGQPTIRSLIQYYGILIEKQGYANSSYDCFFYSIDISCEKRK